MNKSVSLSALVLAAGKGTRMKSHLPKVLHPLLGRPMVSWVIGAVKGAGVADVTLVLNSDTAKFNRLVEQHEGLRIVIQNNQKGTGDAVASASKAYAGVSIPRYASGDLKVGQIIGSDWVLIVAGDTPAISAHTLKAFIDSTVQSGKGLSVLGMEVPDPRGYGRLVRAPNGGLLKIVEERDADPDTKKIKLCNSGVILSKCSILFEYLDMVAPHNSQNEYYLTDIFQIAASKGLLAHVFEAKDSKEFSGINDRIQLDSLERWMLDNLRRDAMASGVTFHIPETVFIDSSAKIEQDVEIFSSVSVRGTSKIAMGVQLQSGVHIEDCEVGAGSVIGANSVLTRLKVMAGSRVPPGTIRTEMDF